MDVMKRYPDNYFDLAIVDPPYFSGPEQREFYGNKISPIGVHRLYGKTTKWEIPEKIILTNFLEFQKIKLFGA